MPFWAEAIQQWFLNNQSKGEAEKETSGYIWNNKQITYRGETIFILKNGLMVE